MGTKVTYVTLFADPSLDPSYEATLKEVEKKYLGRSYPIYIGGEEVWTGEEFEDRSPVDTSILVGRFQKAGREGIGVRGLRLCGELRSLSTNVSMKSRL
jgi:1-pyrroline-5-carboxylate dehydrogenase